MTLLNYVPERGRVYVRRFDHEEACERFIAGATLAELASDYGVSKTRIWQVVTPGAKARMVEAQRQWRTGSCESCGGPAMRLVHGKKEHNRDGRCLCQRCRSDEKRERLRFDDLGQLAAVRCSNIDCANGDRWQQPENFTAGSRHREVRPNGIHSTCRACQTRTKARYRAAHPEYRRTNGSANRRRNAEAVQTKEGTES